MSEGLTLSSEDIIDYVSGTIDPQRRTRVDACLRADPAQAEEVRRIAEAWRAVSELAASTDDGSDIGLRPNFNERLRQRLASAAAADDGVPDEAELLNHPMAQAVQSIEVELRPDFNERLRRRLEAAQADRATAAEPAVASAGVEGAGRRLVRRLRAPVGIAAVLCLGFGLTTLLLPEPKAHAFDIAQWMRSINSLYLQANYYGKTPYTTEVYAERPQLLWMRTTGRPGFEHAWINHGNEWMIVNHDDRRVDWGDDVPAYLTRLQVEGWFQTGGLRNFISGHGGADFVRLGPDADRDELMLYEERDSKGRRTRVWVDPDSGDPVYLRVYERFKNDQGDEERLLIDCVEIRADAPAPVSLQQMRREIPPDYIDEQRDRLPHEHVLVGGDAGCIRFAFNLRDKALLLCWTVMPGEHGGPEADASAANWLHVRPRDDDPDWVGRHEIYRVDAGDGCRWYWSLIVPESGATIGDRTYIFSLRDLPRYYARPQQVKSSDLEALLDTALRHGRPVWSQPGGGDGIRGVLDHLSGER